MPAQTSAPEPAPGPSPSELAANATPWANLPDAAKIERVRLVAARHDRALAELRYFVGELLRHQHDAHGAMVAPLRIQGAIEGGQPDPAKAWL